MFELLVELGDCPVERAAAANELAREPDLQLLLLPGEPAADPFQMRGAAEHPQWHDESGVERVQVPARPLLRPAARVDEIVAVIDE